MCQNKIFIEYFPLCLLSYEWILKCFFAAPVGAILHSLLAEDNENSVPHNSAKRNGWREFILKFSTSGHCCWHSRTKQRIKHLNAWGRDSCLYQSRSCLVCGLKLSSTMDWWVQLVQGCLRWTMAFLMSLEGVKPKTWFVFFSLSCNNPRRNVSQQRTESLTPWPVSPRC